MSGPRAASTNPKWAAGDTALVAEDFQSLGRYEAYAALVAGGSVQPWCSLRTEPPGPITSDPTTIRAASRERYGIPRREIEADLEQLVRGPGRARGDDLSPRRHASGGRS